MGCCQTKTQAFDELPEDNSTGAAGSADKLSSGGSTQSNGRGRLRASSLRNGSEVPLLSTVDEERESELKSTASQSGRPSTINAYSSFISSHAGSGQRSNPSVTRKDEDSPYRARPGLLAVSRQQEHQPHHAELHPHGISDKTEHKGGAQLPGSITQEFRQRNHFVAGIRGDGTDHPPTDVSHLSGDITVLVSDMTGFTRLTRRYGISHYASLIMRMRTLCYPVVQAYGATFVSTEADDLFVAFSNPVKGLLAAIHCWEVLKAHNSSVANPDFHCKIGGIGMALGPGEQVIVDKQVHKMHGPVVDQAFLLGEDTADDELLITDAMLRKLRRTVDPQEQAMLRCLSFERREMAVEHNSRGQADSEQYRMVYHQVKIMDLPALPLLTVPTWSEVAAKAPPGLFGAEESSKDDAVIRKHVDEYMRLVSERWSLDCNAAEQLSALDNRVKKTFMNSDRPVTVLMYGTHVPLVTRDWGIYQGLKVEHDIHAMFVPLYEQFNGSPLPDHNIVVFKDPVNAVQCALACQRAVQSWNATCEPKDRRELTGMAVHSGSLLVVPGTNVHWGDPVNTTSKLAEDYATHGELMVTRAVHTLVSGNPSLAHVKWTAGEAIVSKVPLKMYVLSEAPAADEQAAPGLSISASVDQFAPARHHLTTAQEVSRSITQYSLRVYSSEEAKRKAMSQVLRSHTALELNKPTFAFEHGPYHTRSGRWRVVRRKIVQSSSMLGMGGGGADAGDAKDSSADDAAHNAAPAPNFVHKSISANFGSPAQAIFVSGKRGTGSTVPPPDCVHLDKPLALLVSDMSGFTRITRKHGICHYATLIMRMRKLCYSVHKAYGAQFVYTEADDCFVGFPDPACAVVAALHCWMLLQKINATISDPDFHCVIGGMGLAYGPGEQVIVDAKRHKVHGPVFDQAFLLGEDTAEDELLVSNHVVKYLEKQMRKGKHRYLPFLKNLEFKTYHDQIVDNWHASLSPVNSTNDLSTTGSQEDYSIVYHAVKLSSSVNPVDLPWQELVIVGNDDEYDTGLFGADVHDSAAVADQRSLFLRYVRERASIACTDKTALHDIDDKMHDAFMKDEKPITVMMYGTCIPKVTVDYGIYQGLKVAQDIHDMFHPFYEQFNGICLEEDRQIVMFDNPKSAVLCARACQRAMLDWNETCERKEQRKIRAFGLHTGTMLVVPGTNVHWGDPVNTSSKLAEDLGQNGELLMTARVHDAVADEPEFSGASWNEREQTVSHVVLPMFILEPDQSRAGAAVAGADAPNVLSERSRSVRSSSTNSDFPADNTADTRDIHM